LTQGFVSKPLKNIDTGVIGVVNRYQHIAILIEPDANGNKDASQLRSWRGAIPLAIFQLLNVRLGYN